MSELKELTEDSGIIGTDKADLIIAKAIIVSDETLPLQPETSIDRPESDPERKSQPELARVATILSEESSKLEELAYVASDEGNLNDVIDDFDKAIKLTSDVNEERCSYNELQQIQSVQSHLSAGIFYKFYRFSIFRISFSFVLVLTISHLHHSPSQVFYSLILG